MRTRSALWVVLVVLGSANVVEAQTLAAIRLRAELEVQTPEGQARQALPLVGERLRAEIDGQNATTTIRQVFRNQTQSQLHGRYVLRTELAARVTGFAYYIGEERIVGEVLERTAAREVYDDVTTVRRDPAILEQTADGEFTFQVFPIQPAEDKRVEITFSEWMERRGGTVTYRVPVGTDQSDAEILLRDPRARDVRSPTHELDMEPLPGGGVRIRTRRTIDWRGELVLRYRVVEEPWSVSAYVHRDPEHPAYFVLSVAAPQGLEGSIAPKDVTLVFDRSGSMNGNAIVNARAAAMDVIQRIGENDRLNVIAFDDDVDPLFVRPRPVDRNVRDEALRFVGGLMPGGGTDLAFALRSALAAQHDDDPARPHVVVFLTDGQSAPEPVLELAATDRTDARVFTVGLGDGVNRALLSRLAADKRGTFTYIANAQHIEAEVGHLYTQIARPLLVGVSLEVEGGVASRIYPRTLPDLFADDELTISGRLRGDGPVRFVLRGRVGDRPVELRARMELPASAQRPWVGRRWAISRVDDLLEEIQLKGEEPETRNEVISLALAYDFATPYTAFLAIPEREVTATAAQTLARARAQREQAQQQHADAARLNTQLSSRMMHSASPQPQPQVVVTAQAAPRSGTFDMGAGDTSGGGGAEADEEAPMAAEASPAMDASIGGMPGCASCSVVSRDRPVPWVSISLVLGLFFFRRWRRA